MKLISDMVIDSFYKPFTENALKLGGFSRGQVSGAPCDILTAYSLMDVPESEALLYEPSFSRIVASAALLGGKKVVSAETFTCLYGWPRNYIGQEQTADLKLLADALFANGVNHIIWHGKPMNPAGMDTVKFYASVHVGKSGNLAQEMKQFNKYLETVSTYMKKGQNYSDIAVYLPIEDAWTNGEMPKEMQFKWAWGYYELRFLKPPSQIIEYHPIFINHYFLKQAEFENNLLMINNVAFKSLYVDVKHLDMEALKTIKELAKKGLRIYMMKSPEQAGKRKTDLFDNMLKELLNFPNVKTDLNELHAKSFEFKGDFVPDYWCRHEEGEYYVFIANPKSKEIKFPMDLGQSFNQKSNYLSFCLNFGNKEFVFDSLEFKPYQSVLIHITKELKTMFIDIEYIPESPQVIIRNKNESKPWLIN